MAERRVRLGIGCLIGLVLAACGLLETGLPQPTLTIDAVAIATAVRHIAETQTAQVTTPPDATRSALPALSQTASPVAEVTATALLEAEAATPPANCPYWPAESVAQPLPEASALTWSPQQGASGRWLALDGFYSPVLQVTPAPGGRWWAMLVLREAVAAGPWQTALYIVDGAGSSHWMASREGALDLNTFAWLADGALVWVDQQRLWRSQPNGADRQDLNMPEAVMEVWAGAESRLLVSGASGLWRQGDDGAWSRVAELDPLAARLGEQPFSRPHANLAIAPGGDFAALQTASEFERSNGQLWRIPLDPAQPAQLVADFSYLGRGGRMPAPAVLADGAYWDPAQMVGKTVNSNQITNVLIQPETGEWLEISGLLPADESFLTYQVSTDGQWLAIISAPADANPAEAEWSVTFYLASTLEPGPQVRGDMVLGWRSFPASAWVVNRSSEGQAVQQVALPGGEVRVLQSLSSEALPAVRSSPSSLYLFASSRLWTFNLQGQPGVSYPLPVGLIETTVREIGPAEQVLLAGVTAEAPDGQCSFRFPVVLWSLP